MKLVIMVRIAVKYNIARFEILTVVLLKVEVLWDVVLCKLLKSCLYFEGSNCLYFHVPSVQLSQFLDPLSQNMKLL